jgi:hypothetical protein
VEQGDPVIPSALPIIAGQGLCKYVSTAINCWRCCFPCGPCSVKLWHTISSSQNFLFKNILLFWIQGPIPKYS